MKSKDIATIVGIGLIGILGAAFGCNALMGEPQDVSFKTVGVIGSDVDNPDPEVFNAGAINPTVEVKLRGCQDVDRNGIIDEVEKMACDGAVFGETVSGDEATTEEEAREESADITDETDATDEADVTDTADTANSGDETTEED